MTTVHQVLATLSYGDAIGNEVLGIQRVLRGKGMQSDIFVETADPRLEGLTRSYREMPDAVGADDLLIHHFSIGSKASRIAYALPARMMLVYHNITPPSYFVGVNKELIERCYLGRRELTAYARRCELAVGDSEFNRAELEELGFAPTAVLPVVPDFSHLDVEPEAISTREFDDDWTNIVFVGRVIPNKRFDDLIRIFHAYRTRYNARSRLLLVGSYTGFENYRTQLDHLIAELKTADVHFSGHITNEELAAFYGVADLFLSASEHEGFCVPLTEAFYMGVPVLAYAATAVPWTMHGGGMLYTDKDPAAVAALMDSVLSDDAARDAVLASQDAALERLLAEDFAATLLQHVEAALAAPRRRFEVAFDFWQQVDTFERLRALKKTRPALYEALPLPDARRANGGAAHAPGDGGA
ncbi:MAG TPA: glycosyltransferase [Vicinamibacterales bacterium]|nr:glycosyltransferase [Vicinamibacterales bacterium]